MLYHSEYGFPLTTVFDDNFFVQPYDEYDLREFFDDILDHKLFDETAWSTSYACNSVFNFTQGKSDEADAQQLSIRREEAQKFIDAVNEFVDEDNSECEPIRCEWFNGDKNAIKFMGYRSKEELAKKVDQQFPRPDKSIVTNPQEILDILNAMDGGLDVHWKILPDSTLLQLLKDPDASDRFIDAMDVFGLQFRIDDENADELEMELPIISMTRPDTYQARLSEIKEELTQMVNATLQKIDQAIQTISQSAKPTQYMTVGQYQQYLKDNQKFHFFGKDKEIELEDLQTTFIKP